MLANLCPFIFLWQYFLLENKTFCFQVLDDFIKLNKKINAHLWHNLDFELILLQINNDFCLFEVMPYVHVKQLRSCRDG